MEELRKCHSCGYERGFHISFRKSKNKIKVCLVCPNCGQSYDLEWQPSEIKHFKTEKGPIY